MADNARGYDGSVRISSFSVRRRFVFAKSITHGSPRVYVLALR